MKATAPQLSERQRIRRAALWLLGLSLSQVLLSLHGTLPLHMLAFVALAFSFFKSRALVLDFMGLRGVSGPWRPLMFGWLVSVVGLVLLSFSLSA